MANKKNQQDQILHYLQTHRGMTRQDAIRHFGCTELPARVWELKNLRGCHISKEMIEVECKDGRKTRVAYYSLSEE